MSRVARAARVASRQRVEAISASKTIQSAETGETYLISALCTITLPKVQDGAYFSFIVKDDLNGLQTTNLVIRSETAADKMVGYGTRVLLNGNYSSHVPTPTDGAAKFGEGHSKLTFADGSGDTHLLMAGSEIECFSDGTSWYVNYKFLTNHTSNITAVFGDI
jgi:hypothetical protein